MFIKCLEHMVSDIWCAVSSVSYHGHHHYHHHHHYHRDSSSSSKFETN